MKIEYRCQMCGCIIDGCDCILAKNEYGDLCSECTDKIILMEDYINE